MEFGEELMGVLFFKTSKGWEWVDDSEFKFKVSCNWISYAKRLVSDLFPPPLAKVLLVRWRWVVIASLVSYGGSRN